MAHKTDLINSVATKTGLSKKDADAAVGAFLEAINESLKSGETVTLIGFGTLSVVKRAARTGRNPQTGKEIKIPASKTVKFKAGKGLKKAVN